MALGSGVYVLRDADTLVAMQPASFASEDDFQRLLASFPELLAGDQINPDAPRRFMLVAREQGIAGEEGGADRWSLDHLFLDQDGIPTLVEVKRGTDTRIRREVVGQMLDYAANSILHWPVEELRGRMVSRCDAEGRDAEAVVSELIGEDADPEAFWTQVRTNLQAGRIRLLFVADRIPAELRRVVEFLNRQMQPAEVLAVELRQFEGQGLKALVPLVLGQTQDATQRKGGGRPALTKRDWDENAVIAAIAANADPHSADVAGQLIAWVHQHADRVRFGSNPQWGWIAPDFVRDGIEYQPFRVWSDGNVSIQFQYLLGKPILGTEEVRRGLLDLLNMIDGVRISETSLTKRPSLPLKLFARPGAVGEFLAAMHWLVNELRVDTHQSSQQKSTPPGVLAKPSGQPPGQ